MTRQYLHRLEMLAPWLLGLLAFLVVVGPRVLDPANLAWLRGGDSVTHYLGWLFFRQGGWSFPPGLNPDYGLELSNAIVYSDSIPLLALFFKLFDAVLPPVFQYFGLWLLGCFLLQAYFGWKLAGLLSASVAVRMLACLLFLFAPPMLWRLSGHWALSGHFLLLAGLWLVLRPDMQRRRLAWAVLLAVACLVHAYLLAMVAMLWLADFVDRLRCRQLGGRLAALEPGAVIVLVVATAWLAGYFSVGEGLADSAFYGHYRANLLALVDPSGWSHFLRDLPEGAGDYEGFNFLGLGMILLGVMLLPMLPGQGTAFRALVRRHLGLGTGLLLIAAFAFTHKPALGMLEATLPMPDSLLDIAELFRSSGRMLWPVFYALVLLIIAGIVRCCSHRRAVTLLAFAAVVQVLDTRIAWDGRHDALMVKREEMLVAAPQDPFWEEAAGRYDKVRWLPPANLSPYWLNIASFAGSHGMATNAVYLARVDNDAHVRANAAAAESIASGNYDEDTLYILDDALLERAQASLHAERDLLTRVDRVLVIAPGWKRR